MQDCFVLVEIGSKAVTKFECLISLTISRAFCFHCLKICANKLYDSFLFVFIGTSGHSHQPHGPERVNLLLQLADLSSFFLVRKKM